MRVLVTGFFDLMHTGHLKFLKKASKYGELYVNIGNDLNMKEQKDRTPIFNELEREEMLNALEFVKRAFVSKRIGFLDFEEAIDLIKPDLFCINSDGDTEEKRELCKRKNIEYIVLFDRPEDSISSTKIREKIKNEM